MVVLLSQVYTYVIQIYMLNICVLLYFNNASIKFLKNASGKFRQKYIKWIIMEAMVMGLILLFL